ncbi:MAG TPA: fluoride efflux transporter CrcB [Flavisolibacter sp.]|jgi:CrcB protein|nr:fluoride efflux transporter CrcB [Flavisolibacter sp.]
MNGLWIALGGAAGSLLRYGCSRWLNGSTFPLGTFAVNITGSFLIGLLLAWFTKQSDEPARLFLITGFCGGFTTFSAFSLEGLQMLQQGKFAPFFLYTFATIIFGLLATYTGFKLMHT